MRTTRPDLRARTGLGIWPTPLQSADDQAGIYVKREDLCGFAFGDSPSALADRVEARCGTLLDPVFAGPAWHAFCAQRPDPGRAAVLVSSGGLPAYFDATQRER